MITGIQFPNELVESKDLKVFKKYLNSKSKEDKSSYIPWAVATLLSGGAGYLVGKHSKAPTWKVTASAAGIPATLGLGLIEFDNSIIDKAKKLQNASNKEVSEYLEKRVHAIKNRPLKLQALFKTQEMISKTASMKVNNLGKVLLGLGALSIPAVMLSKKKRPEKWKVEDPVTIWSKQPQILIRS